MGRGSRDSRCSALPLSRCAAGAPHWGHSSIAEQPVVGRKDAGASPAGLVRRSLVPASGARAVPHSPRAGGTSRDDRHTHAVVAQRNESTWLRTRGSGVRISPTALRLIERGWCKRIGTRGCGSLRAGSRPVPLIRTCSVRDDASSIAQRHTRRRPSRVPVMHPDTRKGRSSVGRATDIPSPIPLPVSRAEGIEGYRI